MNDYSNTINLIPDEQHGFVKNLNTENTVLEFIERSVQAIDESGKCLAVLYRTTKISRYCNKLDQL